MHTHTQYKHTKTNTPDERWWDAWRSFRRLGDCAVALVQQATTFCHDDPTLQSEIARWAVLWWADGGGVMVMGSWWWRQRCLMMMMTAAVLLHRFFNTRNNTMNQSNKAVQIKNTRLQSTNNTTQPSPMQRCYSMVQFCGGVDHLEPTAHRLLSAEEAAVFDASPNRFNFVELKLRKLVARMKLTTDQVRGAVGLWACVTAAWGGGGVGGWKLWRWWKLWGDVARAYAGRTCKHPRKRTLAPVFTQALSVDAHIREGWQCVRTCSTIKQTALPYALTLVRVCARCLLWRRGEGGGGAAGGGDNNCGTCTRDAQRRSQTPLT